MPSGERMTICHSPPGRTSRLAAVARERTRPPPLGHMLGLCPGFVNQVAWRVEDADNFDLAFHRVASSFGVRRPSGQQVVEAVEGFRRSLLHARVVMSVTRLFVGVEDVACHPRAAADVFELHDRLPLRISEHRLVEDFGGFEAFRRIDFVVSSREGHGVSAGNLDRIAPATADTEVDLAGEELRRPRSPPVGDVFGFRHRVEDDFAGSVEFARHQDFGIGRQRDRQTVLNGFRHVSPCLSSFCFWTGVRPNNHRVCQSSVPRTGDSLPPTSRPV